MATHPNTSKAAAQCALLACATLISVLAPTSQRTLAQSTVRIAGGGEPSARLSSPADSEHEALVAPNTHTEIRIVAASGRADSAQGTNDLGRSLAALTEEAWASSSHGKSAAIPRHDTTGSNDSLSSEHPATEAGAPEADLFTRLFAVASTNTAAAETAIPVFIEPQRSLHVAQPTNGPVAFAPNGGSTPEAAVESPATAPTDLFQQLFALSTANGPAPQPHSNNGQVPSPVGTTIAIRAATIEPFATVVVDSAKIAMNPPTEPATPASQVSAAQNGGQDADSAGQVSEHASSAPAELASTPSVYDLFGPLNVAGSAAAPTAAAPALSQSQIATARSWPIQSTEASSRPEQPEYFGHTNARNEENGSTLVTARPFATVAQPIMDDFATLPSSAARRSSGQPHSTPTAAPSAQEIATSSPVAQPHPTHVAEIAQPAWEEFLTQLAAPRSPSAKQPSQLAANGRPTSASRSDQERVVVPQVVEPAPEAPRDLPIAGSPSMASIPPTEQPPQYNFAAVTDGVYHPVNKFADMSAQAPSINAPANTEPAPVETFVLGEVGRVPSTMAGDQPGARAAEVMVLPGANEPTPGYLVHAQSPVESPKVVEPIPVGAGCQPGVPHTCPYLPGQSGAPAVCGVDCGQYGAPCASGWNDAGCIPWSLFGPGEYVGPPRTEHVSTYYLRVDDMIMLTFIASRRKEAERYRIGCGDQLRIEWLRSANTTDTPLDRDVLVQPDGTIALPLVGEINVAGKTVQEVRDELIKSYGQFQRDPQITVAPLDVNLAVKDIISAVTGVSGSNGQTQSLRVTPEGTIQAPGLGSVYVQGLTLDELRNELEARYATTFGPGLLVSPALAERAATYVFVGGEVRNPGRYQFEGPTTVSQAITMAGGWNVGGNLHQIVVFRRDENWCLKATKIDIRASLYGNDPCPANDVWLRDNDHLIVPKSKILCATDVVQLYFTRGIYAVFPISYVYDFSSSSGIVPVP